MVSVIQLIKGFFTVAVLRVALVNIIAGTIVGYIIGYVAVYDTMNSINEDCTSYTTQAACESVKFTECKWYSSSKTCAFITNCGAFKTKDECSTKKSDCYFNYDDDKCTHYTGFTPTEVGIFAGGMTVGGIFGSFGGGPLVHLIGRKWTIVVAGVFGLLCSLFLHIGRGSDVYALLVVGRVFSGVCMGTLCVCAPMYVEEMAPEAYRRPVGAFFQVFLTFGIFLAATIGLIVEPRDFAKEQNNEVRIQMFTAVQTLLGVLCVLVGLITQESEVYLRMRRRRRERAEAEADAAAAIVHHDAHAATIPTKLAEEPIMNAMKEMDKASHEPATFEDEETEFTWLQMVGPLLIATALCAAQQLTGINAIMNYAPKISGDAMGLRPMLGNFVIMLWNFIATLGSIPLSSRVPFRWMYVGGTAVAVVALLITGIPVYPGVAPEDVKNGLAGFGIFLFILAFECGMGPAFYPLCQQLFPHSFRPKGSAYANGIQLFFNLIINVCFPIATEGLSGGPDGNQNKGFAIVFFFFAVAGFISLIILFKWLHPYNSVDNKSAIPAVENEREKDAVA